MSKQAEWLAKQTEYEISKNSVGVFVVSRKREHCRTAEVVTWRGIEPSAQDAAYILLLEATVERFVAEVERRGILLEDVVTEVAPYKPTILTPNMVGTDVPLEPSPAEMVAEVIGRFSRRNELLMRAGGKFEIIVDAGDNSDDGQGNKGDGEGVE